MESLFMNNAMLNAPPGTPLGTAILNTFTVKPERWCSDGFDTPAELISDEPGHYLLKIPGQPDVPMWNDDLGPFLWASLRAHGEGDKTEETTVEVVIYRDRIFWLCD
jgi:hypothetical protein